MGLKFFMAPHKFSMLVTIEGYKAEKLLNMKGTKVRCEISRGTKMVATYWEPAGAVSPGVAIFDQQMMQTVTLYKGNTGWNPKYYDFKLVAISNEYGKKTIASASINLSQLANLDPDAPITKELQLPVDGKVPGKLTVKLECKYKSIGVKKKGTPSEAASDTDFEMMEKPRTNKPMAALVEEELLEEEEEPETASIPAPAPAPAPSLLGSHLLSPTMISPRDSWGGMPASIPRTMPTSPTMKMSPMKEETPARASPAPARESPLSPVTPSLSSKFNDAATPSPVRTLRLSQKQEKLAQAGSFLVFNPDKFAVNKKKQGLRLNIKPLVGVLGAVVAAAAAVLLQQQQQQQQQQQPKAKGGCRTTHAVKRGENVYAVGKKYNVAPADLLGLNKRIVAPGAKSLARKGTQLQEGETLCVRL